MLSLSTSNVTDFKKEKNFNNTGSFGNNKVVVSDDKLEILESSKCHVADSKDTASKVAIIEIHDSLPTSKTPTIVTAA